MAEKLTDESVAKALGYFVTTKGGVPSIRRKLPDGRWDRSHSLRLPAFTTSLDAIVAEVEARGLWWTVSKCGDGTYAATVGKHYCAPYFPSNGHKTAPLALCAALLAYLKEGSE